MATRKSDAERLQELEKKMEQLKNQKKAIQARVSEQNRKARTRRLIQLGALSEKYFGCPDIEPEEFEKLLKHIVSTEDINMLLLSRKVEQNAAPESGRLDGDEPIFEQLANAEIK